MDDETWWKNFSLQLELEISGAFIYNGLRTLHSVPSFDNEATSFEILYNLSVGIERLQKVTIVLLESQEWPDQASLGESLKGHSTSVLADRIEKRHEKYLAPIHRELLNVLSNFYDKHRYGNFSFASAVALSAERNSLLAFLIKHLQIDAEAPDLAGLPNSDQIRCFMGKVVKRIVGPLYEVIRTQARQLGIFTYELSSDSKAGRIFLYEKLNFVDDGFIRREILLHLLHPASDSVHLKNIREFSPLELDSGLDAEYIAYLLDETPARFSQVEEEVETAFEGIEKVGERLEFLRIMDQAVDWVGPSSDLLPFLRERFGSWLEQSIVGINLLLVSDSCILEVIRQPERKEQTVTKWEPISLQGLAVSMDLDHDDLRRHEDLLREWDAYTWLMLTDIFHADAQAEIAAEWESREDAGD